MSITKEQLLKKAAPRFEWVEVEGLGRVGLRSVSRLQASLREASYRDPGTGLLMAEEVAKADAYMIIDQVMVDEKTPMFTDADLADVAALDAMQLGPLYTAINEFNTRNGTPKK